MEQGGWSGRELIRRIVGSTSIGFPHIPVWVQDRVFEFLLAFPGPSPAGCEGVRWQTGTLFNRTGVVPVRLNTVYAFNRLHLTGLEPGPPALYLAELTSLPRLTVSLYAQTSA